MKRKTATALQLLDRFQEILQIATLHDPFIAFPIQLRLHVFPKEAEFTV